MRSLEAFVTSVLQENALGVICGTPSHTSSQEKKKGPGRDINRLLNRLLGVHIDVQKRIFSYFMLLLVRRP